MPYRLILLGALRQTQDCLSGLPDKLLAPLPENVSDDRKILPSNIRNNLALVHLHAPKTKQHITTFNTALGDLKKHLDKRNFGSDLEACRTLIDYESHEVQLQADKAIVNLCPVAAFIHYTVRNALRDLV